MKNGTYVFHLKSLIIEVCLITKLKYINLFLKTWQVEVITGQKYVSQFDKKVLKLIDRMKIKELRSWVHKSGRIICSCYGN